MKYYDNTLLTTISIIFKLSTAAVSMNIALTKRYPNKPNLYEPENKNSWIYYQNLRGERFTTLEVKDANGIVTHEAEVLQCEVYVNNIETGEKMVLNKTNLLSHPLTLTRLKNMDAYYMSLVSNYPDQELRIRAIIFDLVTDPLTASDGTILLVNKTLIEDNEFSLIDTLETRIKNHLSRWDLREFVLVDDNYVPILLAAMTQKIYLDILNIRNSNINTLEVHSYHMRNYFNSNMHIGVHTSVLAKKEKFWLYRNLSTLVHDMGTNKTLELIIDNLLKPSGVKVFKYDVKPLKPSKEGVISDIYNKDRLIETETNVNISLDGMLILEDNDNPLKDIVYKDTGYRDSIFHRVSKTSGITEPTKILMLKAVRTTLLESTELDIILLETVLLYLSTTTAVYTFKDEATNITYKRTGVELIYTILSIFQQINKSTISLLGGLYLRNVLKPLDRLPGTKGEVLGVDGINKSIDIINTFIAPIENVNNKELLNSYIDNVGKAHSLIKYYKSNVGNNKLHDLMSRSLLKASVTRRVPLTTANDLTTYINENKLSIFTNGKREDISWYNLLNTIFDTVSGKTFTVNDAGKMSHFKALLDKLTSYSLQTLTSTGTASLGTNERSVGYFYDMGAIKIIKLTTICGSKAGIVSGIANDANISNTLITKPNSFARVMEAPILTTNKTSGLNEKITNATIV